jgi:formylglycine-generating enzyme required for sulfatase activity
MRTRFMIVVVLATITGSGLRHIHSNAQSSEAEDATKLRDTPGALASGNTRNADSEQMALIPGGTFAMGIDETDLKRYQEFFQITAAQLFEPAMPKHTVTVDGFLMDRNLVTNAAFKRFVQQHPEWGTERIPGNLHNGHYLEHWKAGAIPQGRAAHPVVNVSWYAAVAFCQAKGKRLPTETEWEHAAKGKLEGIFPWGNVAADKTRANFSDSGLATTSKVASYPANGYGLFDMAGNVWEYLADEWQPYRSEAQKNPVGGNDFFDKGDNFLRVKSRRVIRGGSFGGAPINMWVEYRDSHPPENAKEFVGFRCAKSNAK